MALDTLGIDKIATGHTFENCDISQNKDLEQYLDTNFGLTSTEKNLECGRDENSNLFPQYMRMTEGQLNKKNTRLSPEYINKHFYVFKGMGEVEILDGFVYSSQLDRNKVESAHISFDLELVRNHRRYAVQNVGHDLTSNDNMLIDSLVPREDAPRMLQVVLAETMDRRQWRLTETRFCTDHPKEQPLRQGRNSNWAATREHRCQGRNYWRMSEPGWLPAEDGSDSGTTGQRMGQWFFSRNNESQEYSLMSQNPIDKAGLQSPRPFQRLTATEVMDQLVTQPHRHDLDM
ncbi:OLC1v1029513C1 [Oldenlandia corymbosa var. corymbosa]|uniref:OLC1v1029513C1 n=1 Tax=Oldenlandia corymbosa var. corymbosa TaxID=529605 RepID=A0AAV1CE06_OLDCO|nr:OLC1v1029513C1 [Oldenlandia corymbosa var. corymbosa]